MSKQWLTVEQAAEILQVKPTTVRSYINLDENPLPATLLPGRRGGYRIDPDELDKWMRDRRKTDQKDG